jgi:hypothetical protein
MPNNPRQPDELSAGAGKGAKLWAHLDDFTAGMYDHSWIANESPGLTAPLGAADANQTWACMSLPLGGLGPMPGIANTYGVGSSLGHNGFITGLALNPGLSQGNNPELIFIFEGDNGTNHFANAWSYQIGATTLTSIYSFTLTTQAGYFGSPYPTWTRMYPAAGSLTVGYQPVLVWPAAFQHDAHANYGHVYVYPSPEAPTTYGVLDLITGAMAPFSSITGQVVCYDGRVLVLSGTSYPWPNLSGNTVVTNENINFTFDPVTDGPGSENLGEQLTTLAAEEPWGYSASGSVSTGELFLVKRQGGGGVSVNGDIIDPNSVIYYPGVQDGGDFYGHADSGEIGIVYCSENRGAHVWNGGNTSQKISLQIRDDFYDCTKNVIQSNNYGFFCQRWNDLILFSNNYVYNMRTSAWWKLFPNFGQTASGLTGINFFHYAFGTFGNQFYAAPISFPSGSVTVAYQFDNNSPSLHWQWQSTPIHLQANADHVVDLRRLIVRAMTLGTTSTITVSIYDNSSNLLWTNSSAPISVTTSEPAPYRLNLGNDSTNPGLFGLTDFVVRIQADSNSGTAPILNSLDLEYETRAHVVSVN